MRIDRVKHLTADQRTQIADLYTRGEKVLVIADLFNVTSSYVCKLARRRDLPMRRPTYRRAGA